jgi:hypothetical protein
MKAGLSSKPEDGLLMKLIVLNVTDAYSILFEQLKFNRPPISSGANPASIAEKVTSQKLKTGEAERFMVDQNGAEITSRSGRIKLKIGQDVLESATYLDIIEPSDSAIAADPVWGRIFEIKAESVAERQASAALRAAIQIEYFYNPAEFSGKEDGIRLFYYAEKLHSWLILPGHTDRRAKRVVGKSTIL